MERYMQTGLQPQQPSLDSIRAMGECFVKKFFDTFDNRRALLPHLYAEELILLWNNINMNGTITITPMFMNLPVSQHSIERIRVTPYFGQVPVTVVDVLGQVKYGDRPPCRFKWDFVLRGVTPEGCLLISTTVMLPYHGI